MKLKFDLHHIGLFSQFAQKEFGFSFAFTFLFSRDHFHMGIGEKEIEVDWDVCAKIFQNSFLLAEIRQTVNPSMLGLVSYLHSHRWSLHVKS